MTSSNIPGPARAPRRGANSARLAPPAILASVLLLGACSSVSNIASPSQWFGGADDKPAAGAEAAPGPGKPFPNLASVPEAPTPTTAEERKRMAESLIADRDNAHYTDEVIRRQTEELQAPEGGLVSAQAAAAKKAAAAKSAVLAKAHATAEAEAIAEARAEAEAKAEARAEAEAIAEARAAAEAEARTRAQALAEERMRNETALAARSQRLARQAREAEIAASRRSAGIASSVRSGTPATRIPARDQASNQARAVRPIDREERLGEGRLAEERLGAPRPFAARPPPPPVLPAIGARPRLARIAPAGGVRDAAPNGARLAFGPPPGDIGIVQRARAVRAPPPPTNPAAFNGRGSAVMVAPTTAAPARRSLAGLTGTNRVAVAKLGFATGSAAIGSAGRRMLRAVVTAHRRRGGTVRIVGHASSRTRNMDATRHALVNFQISLDRANSVARALMSMGVPARSIAIGARSDSQPRFFEVMPSGEAGNRRVEVFLDGSG